MIAGPVIGPRKGKGTMMKSTVKWSENGRTRQRTAEVDRNDPNAIIRQFVAAGILRRGDFVKTVKCGNRVYLWEGRAWDAFPTVEQRFW